MGLLQGDGCSFHPPSRAPVFWKLRRTLLELPPRPCFFRQSAARTTERASSSSQKGSSNTESHVSIKSCVWVVGRKPCQGSIAGGSGERTRACPSATLSGRRLTPPPPDPGSSVPPTTPTARAHFQGTPPSERSVLMRPCGQNTRPPCSLLRPFPLLRFWAQL